MWINEQMNHFKDQENITQVLALACPEEKMLLDFTIFTQKLLVNISNTYKESQELNKNKHDIFKQYFLVKCTPINFVLKKWFWVYNFRLEIVSKFHDQYQKSTRIEELNANF